MLRIIGTKIKVVTRIVVTGIKILLIEVEDIKVKV